MNRMIKPKWILNFSGLLFIFSFYVASTLSAQSYTIIWSEEFNYPNGTTSSSKFSVDVSNCNLSSGDYFEVRSNQFHIRDTDGEGVWTSAPIDISNYVDIHLLVNVGESGSLESSDYIRFYYKLDGGPEVPFDENGDLSDDFGSTAAVAYIGQGNSVVIVIKGQTNSGNELIAFDGIYVTGYQGTYVFTEDFSSYSDGTTSSTEWTRDVSNCNLGNGDYFEVRHHGFEGNDLDGEALWTSRVIDISNYTDLQATVDLFEYGNMENRDYIMVYYKIDNGPMRLFSDYGINVNDFVSEEAVQSNINGNTLQIIIKVNNSSSDEIHRFDNVLVYGFVNNNPQISGSVTDVSCNGGNDGAIDISVTNGSTPYTYAWSNGATTEDITGLTDGTYTVTVTEAGGASASKTFTVNEPSALTGSVSTSGTSCTSNTGSIDLTVSGGTTPYTYLWSNGSTTQDISNLAAGTYTVTITDANNCTLVKSGTVSQASSPSVSLSSTNPSNGLNNGAITTTVTGGQSPYTYSWSNGMTTQNLSNLGAGSYSVTVTDANNCTATASATLTQSSGPTVIFSDDFEGQVNWLQYTWLGNGSNYWVIANSNCSYDDYSLQVRQSFGYCTYRANRSHDIMAYTQIDATGYENLTLTFTWKCVGEAGYDYGSVWYSLDDVTYYRITTGGTSGNGWYENNNSWVTATITLPDAVENKEFWIGFDWINDGSWAGNPPFIIDDVRITGDPVSNAFTFTGAVNSDWHVAGNWDRGAVPDCDDDVVISGKTVNINSNASCNTLTLSPSSGSDTYLKVNGNAILNVCGNLSATHTDNGDDIELEINSAAKVAVAGDATFSIAGSNSQVIRLDLNGNSSGGLFVVNGTTKFELATNNQNGGIVTDINDASIRAKGGMQVIQKGNTAGDIEFNLNGHQTDSASIVVTGDLTINHTGGDEIIFDLNNYSRVYVSEDFIADYTGTTSEELYLNLDDYSYITVEDTMRLVYTGTGNNDEDIRIDLNGSSSLNAGTLILRNKSGNDYTVRLNNNGGDNARINVSNNFIIDQRIGADDVEFKLLGQNSAIRVEGDFIIQNANTNDDHEFYIEAYNNSLVYVGGDLQLKAYGEGVTGITLSQGAKIQLGGDLTRLSYPNNYGYITFNDTSSIELIGSSPQTITGFNGRGNDDIVIKNLKINNTSSTYPQVTLGGTVKVTGTLDLTDGYVYTGNDTLIILNTDEDAIINYGPQSYVVGYLTRYLSGQNNKLYAFPLGRSGGGPSKYHRADILDKNMNGVTYLTATVTPLERSNDLTALIQLALQEAGITYTYIAPEAMWTIEPDQQPTSGKYDIRAYITNLSGLVDNQFGILKRPRGATTAAAWRGGGDGPNPFGGLGRLLAHGYALRKGLREFSEFGVGGGSGGTQPIELLHFDAQLKDGKVYLDWATAVEINNDFFTIERSNGVEFEEILTIDGAGNSSEERHYSAIDENPPTGVLYYRLKQTDFDGTFTYSDPVVVFNNHQTPQVKMRIYPNPTTGNMFVYLETVTPELSITVFDQKGTIVYYNEIQNHSNNILHNINLRGQLAPGVYFVKVNYEDQQLSDRFIVE